MPQAMEPVSSAILTHYMYSWQSVNRIVYVLMVVYTYLCWAVWLSGVYFPWTHLYAIGQAPSSMWLPISYIYNGSFSGEISKALLSLKFTCWLSQKTLFTSSTSCNCESIHMCTHCGISTHAWTGYLNHRPLMRDYTLADYSLWQAYAYWDKCMCWGVSIPIPRLYCTSGWGLTRVCIIPTETGNRHAHLRHGGCLWRHLGEGHATWQGEAHLPQWRCLWRRLGAKQGTVWVYRVSWKL